MDRQEMINGDMTTNAFLNSIDDQIIEVLEDVLKKHDIPSSWYSFEMEKEYVVAMLFNDERWQVIYNEKGIREVDEFDSITDACEHLIYSVSDDDEICKSMVDDFRQELSKPRNVNLNIMKVIQKIKKAASSAAVF